MAILKICVLFSLAVFSLFFAMYLFQKNRTGGINQWLVIAFATLFLCNAIEATFYFEDFKSIIYDRLGFIFYSKEAFEFLILPAIFLYITKFYKLPSKSLIHFLPFFVVLSGAVYYTVFFADNKAILTSHCHRDLWSKPINTSTVFGLAIQLAIYAWLISKVFKKIQPENFPFKKWHLRLCMVVGFIKISWLLDSTLVIFISEFDFQIYLYAFTKAIALIGLFCLVLLELQFNFASNTLGSVREKYSSSGLSNTMKEILTERIKFYFAQKPFLNEEFTIDKMADDLNVSRNYISQIISQEYSSNFRGLINNFRVEASLLLLAEPDSNLNINQIFFEVGFNSKSVFNTVFKKHTGMTPSEYRISVQEKHSALTF